MKTSESIQHLAEALVAAQAEAHNVGFDSTNPHFKNNYSSLHALTSSFRPILARHGLCAMQLPGVRTTGEHNEIIYEVLCTRVIHSASGEWAEEEMLLKAKEEGKLNPCQSQGVAMTYSKRYSLPGVLCCASYDGTDNDGEDDVAQPPVVAPVPVPAKPTMTAQTKASIKSHLIFLATEAELKEYMKELLTTFTIEGKEKEEIRGWFSDRKASIIDHQAEVAEHL